jgi:hypothetical protein
MLQLSQMHVPDLLGCFPTLDEAILHAWPKADDPS